MKDATAMLAHYDMPHMRMLSDHAGSRKKMVKSIRDLQKELRPIDEMILTGEVEGDAKPSENVTVSLANMMTALKVLYEHNVWTKTQSNNLKVKRTK